MNREQSPSFWSQFLFYLFEFEDYENNGAWKDACRNYLIINQTI